MSVDFILHFQQKNRLDTLFVRRNSNDDDHGETSSDVSCITGMACCAGACILLPLVKMCVLGGPPRVTGEDFAHDDAASTSSPAGGSTSCRLALFAAVLRQQRSGFTDRAIQNAVCAIERCCCSFLQSCERTSKSVCLGLHWPRERIQFFNLYLSFELISGKWNTGATECQRHRCCYFDTHWPK